MVLENVTKSHYSLYTEAKSYGECERIKHVGYIKTYKTGKVAVNWTGKRCNLLNDMLQWVIIQIQLFELILEKKSYNVFYQVPVQCPTYWTESLWDTTLRSYYTWSNVKFRHLLGRLDVHSTYIHPSKNWVRFGTETFVVFFLTFLSEIVSKTAGVMIMFTMLLVSNKRRNDSFVLSLKPLHFRTYVPVLFGWW